jgi:2'-5' RNA ligase
MSALAQIPATTYVDDITLFFGLKPPPHIADQITQTARRIGGAHGLDGHWMRTDLLHLTLAPCHQGYAGLDDAIARATALGDGLRHQPLFVSLDQTRSLNNNSGHHPFVLCGKQEMPELVVFRAILRARMRRAGFDVRSGFTPHVTTLWADRTVADNPLRPIFWLADELLLIVSHVGKSRHTHVARWPLR